MLVCLGLGLARASHYNIIKAKRCGSPGAVEYGSILGLGLGFCWALVGSQWVPMRSNTKAFWDWDSVFVGSRSGPSGSQCGRIQRHFGIGTRCLLGPSVVDSRSQCVKYAGILGLRLGLRWSWCCSYVGLCWMSVFEETLITLWWKFLLSCYGSSYFSI